MRIKKEEKRIAGLLIETQVIILEKPEIQELLRGKEVLLGLDRKRLWKLSFDSNFQHPVRKKKKSLLKEKILKWLAIPENQKKTERMTIGGICKIVIGRYPTGPEKRELKLLLEEKNVSFKEKKIRKPGELREKARKWIENPFNKEKVRKMTACKIWKTVIGYCPMGSDVQWLKKVLKERGISFKERENWKKQIQEWLKNPENRKKAEKMSASQIWKTATGLKNSYLPGINWSKKILKEEQIPFYKKRGVRAERDKFKKILKSQQIFPETSERPKIPQDLIIKKIPEAFSKSLEKPRYFPEPSEPSINEICQTAKNHWHSSEDWFFCKIKGRMVNFSEDCNKCPYKP